MNCKFFGPNEAFLCNSHACMREFLGQALTTLLAMQFSVFEALLLTVRGFSWNKNVFKSLLCSATNKFA